MKYPRSNLISINELLEFLEEKGKSRAWLNNLSSRYKLIPKPITLSPKMISIESDDFRIRQGRMFFYLKEIKGYLENIIYLRDHEKLSYNEIIERVAEELRRLNQLMETEPLGDKRLRPEAFLDNYKAAVEICKRSFSWDEHFKILRILNDIPYETRRYGKEYYNCLKKIGMSEGRTEYDELKREKEIIGENLDLLHRVMDSVIKFSLELLGKKKLHIRDWLNSVQKDRLHNIQRESP
jgi:hypothetical protein